MSFISDRSASPNPNERNRFFSPKAFEQKSGERKIILDFYKEYCQVVRANCNEDSKVYIIDVLV